ncbi:MAG TPA: inorganic diphosphatase [Bacillota bacterium]|nr:inorganic diphosphatase [Bacillota bacterium]HOB86651.1 inorganic diphosphatase [Bacillota bacterium]HOP68696.1 inorganic diphosphatase [Bacillota bacterium]HPT33774.1 inorganic diphosphatase [Bacillota bacterium]HPZ64994.1 inorganic diphosphatase [Bacillota bacterium]
MDYVRVFVEVPKGSRNKYEFNKETGRFQLDRMLFSSVHYPADYGFIPETLAEDGDELDALVLAGDPTFPGCEIRAVPVAVLEMWDEKGKDEKVICVSCGDPVWGWITDLDHLPPNLTREISHFFDIYKDLENKPVKVGEWYGKQKAWEVIRASQKRYHTRK